MLDPKSDDGRTRRPLYLRPMSNVSPASGRKLQLQRYVFVKAAQVIGLLVMAFVLLRVVGPWLIDLHSTPALVLAVVLLAGGAFLFAWFGWDLVASIRRRN